MRLLLASFALLWSVGVNAGTPDAPRDLVLTLADASPTMAPAVNATPAASSPDWTGIKQDTGYFIGLQFVAVVALYVAPEDISGWSEEQRADYSFSKYRDNVRNISIDSDKWYINYILHPYWGGTYYVRARERGFDDHQAFWYSALLSALFEFGAEALFEEPSIQDLISTPVAGYFLGQWFMDVRGRIRARTAAGEAPGFGARTVMVLTDPLGVTSNFFGRMLGTDATVTVSPLVVAMAPKGFDDDVPARAIDEAQIAPGLQVHLTW